MPPIEFLYRGLRLNPTGVALESPQGDFTYQELVEAVEALGAYFQSVDPNPQTKIAICGYNSFEFLATILACYATGKIWIPLNPRNGVAELDRGLELTQPDILIVDQECEGKFTWQGGLRLLARSDGTTGRPSVREAIENWRGRRPVAPLIPLNSIQSIKFTGGTTGKPKGVMQTYRTVTTQVVQFQVAYRFAQDDVSLVAMGIGHAAWTLVLPILQQGGKVILMDRPSPAEILTALRTRGITTLYLPPTMVYMLMAEDGVRSEPFPNLRHFFYAAAPMLPEKIREAQAIFGPVIETVYGQVEAPMNITSITGAELMEDRNVGSVGKASALMQVAIAGPDGQFLPPGQVGEVVARGDLMMIGYYQQPDLTAKTLVDGWLHTGDAGMLDERGHLYLKGRVRDMIITGGFNVYPEDVENVLVQHPAVHEASVFGVADSKWGEAVTAAVELKSGASVAEAELISYVKDKLDSVKAPKRVHIVGSLPRNPVGKVVRREVRDLVLGGR